MKINHDFGRSATWYPLSRKSQQEDLAESIQVGLDPSESAPLDLAKVGLYWSNLLTSEFKTMTVFLVSKGARLRATGVP
jgi:hypothetical protein